MPPRRRRPPRAGALSELPPLKIIRSIVLLQTCYYATALVLIFFSTLVLGQPFSLGLILDWTSVRGDVTLGWTIGFIWMLVGFITVIPILLLISRSKLVPDFALTIHLLHLVVTSFYTKAIPVNLLWWSLQAASAALMISLGIWACRYREMQPISFGTLPSSSSVSGNAASKTTRENGTVVEETGHVRGGSNGRSLGDGGPAYEMVERGEGNV